MDMKYVLCIISAFTRMMIGVVIKDKKAENILMRLELEWCMKFGYLSVGFYADNGREFRNYEMEEFVSNLGMSIEFTYHGLMDWMREITIVQIGFEKIVGWRFRDNLGKGSCKSSVDT